MILSKFSYVSEEFIGEGIFKQIFLHLRVWTQFLNTKFTDTLFRNFPNSDQSPLFTIG